MAMWNSTQHRRYAIGAIVLVVLVLILSQTVPESSNVRVPRFLRYTNNKEKSSSYEAELREQDLSMPVGAYTYDDIAEITGDLDAKKDTCERVFLPDGGKKAEPVKDKTLVLVTGGAGFIGSNLVDRLLILGYRVRIYDNLYTGFIRNVPLVSDNVEFFYGDILDRKALQEAIKDVEFVFHLAAMSKVVPSLKDPDMARFCLTSNALGSWNVLEEARIAGKIKKVIYAASSTYYGNAVPPHKENMAPDFLTPYASSKFEGEMQMQTFDSLFGVPTVSTRFFMVYGPRQPTTGAYAIVTGVFAKEAAEGKPLTIEGNGTHARDFIHVHDIAEGLILAQQNPTVHGEVINLGTGASYSVQDLADLVSKDQVHLPPRPHDLVRTLADTCKMKRLLNFQPSTNFVEQMSYMVKATKEGNVFIQDWFTLPLALSSPHLLPVGTPIFAWPKTQDDLDSLLVTLEHIGANVSEIAGHDRRLVTVLPFSLAGDDGLKSSTLAIKELLLNTVFTLVRYGGVVRYMIGATDDKALELCVSLNLPCLDARTTYKSEAELAQALLSRGFDVHFGAIGNSYISSITSFLYNNMDQEIASADTIRTRPQGDYFVRVTDQTRNTFKQMAAFTKTVEKQESQEMPHHVDWKASKVVDYTCDHAVQQELAVPANDLTNNNGSSDAVHLKGTAPHVPRSVSSPCDTGEHRLYVAPSCSHEPISLSTANSTVAVLIEAGAFHLSRCNDPEHCEMQQILPARWLKRTPDLRTTGDFCSSAQ